jgi:hypothetical protein
MFVLWVLCDVSITEVEDRRDDLTWSTVMGLVAGLTYFILT